MIGKEDESLIRLMIGIILSGPSEQLIPIASTFNPSSIAIIDSGLLPVSVFPYSSYTFVTKTGKSEFSFAARTAAFVS